jgi:RNA polymerase sigma-70 factor (ECF subfamily)
VTDLRWIDAALTSARPQAVAALLRYFRDLDTAEEAFPGSLAARPEGLARERAAARPGRMADLRRRNTALDDKRRRSKEQALPSEEALSDDDDAQASLADQLDAEHYRDDILRLLFICCHPELPSTQQIALALRIVSGLTVTEIARAFLVSEAAMEQRITRAKRAIGSAEVPFETPGAEARSDRLAAVAAMIYLLFNEGYSASGGTAHVRVSLCEEAIRLARLLLRLFPSEPEVMGLTALLLASACACACAARSRQRDRAARASRPQLWNRETDRRSAGARREGAAASTARSVSGASSHRSCSLARTRALQIRIGRRSTLSTACWNNCNRHRSSRSIVQSQCSKLRGPAAALEMIEPLGEKLQGYFHFFGAKGAWLHELGRTDEARVAFDKAIALAHTPRKRRTSGSISIAC